MQTDILLNTISQDQPEFESRAYVYFFGGAYELKSILPLVAKNARRKGVQLFHDYIEQKHPGSCRPPGESSLYRRS